MMDDKNSGQWQHVTMTRGDKRADVAATVVICGGTQTEQTNAVLSIVIDTSVYIQWLADEVRFEERND